MAMFDDETPPPGYRWEYSGRGNTAVRYPVLDAPAGEGSDRPIAPHREVPGEVPNAVPTLDQMRFELSQQPQALQLPSLPDYLMNLPREIRDQAAALGEVGASTFFGMLSPIVGAAAGVGKNIYDYFDKGKINPAATKDFANTAAGAVTYQPVIPSAQHIMQLLGEAPAAIMGTGQGLPPVVSGINPRALQIPRGTTGALSAGVKRDISQFDNDVFNAQRGITPGYSTLGSEFSDAFVTPRPTVYDMLAGLEPSRIPSTASPAVKTKGGNFPLSFDNDLEVSGQIGQHLSRKLSKIPLDENRIPNLAKRDPIVEKKWQDFIDSKDISYAQALYWKNNKEYHGRYKELVSEFINQYKDELPQLTTLTDTEKLLQAQNSFIQNQYARYLTNEMGTGAKTDTLVRLAEQGIAVPEIAEVFDVNYERRPEDLVFPWALSPVKKLLTDNKLKGIEAVQQTATTPYGKYIESLADEGVTPTSKKLYKDFLTLQKQLGLPTKYADKPTPFERVPEDMPIWDLPELWSIFGLGLDRIFEKLNTDLKSGAIKPENIKNVSIESLVRGLMDENLKKLAAERKLLLENLKATPRFNVPEPTQLAFVKSPGMTWIDIPETTDAKGLKLCTTLGTQAGWCTQDEKTARHYGSGDSRLTTLVDAEGRPHAQAKIVKSSVDPISEKLKDLDDNIMLEIRAEAAANEPQGDTFRQRVKEAALRRFPEWNNLKTPSDITELKPPENSFTSARSKTYSRRDPEYKAKITDSVQKFLNAEEWGEVKDLSLYGLIDMRGAPGSVRQKVSGAYTGPRFLTKEQAEAAISKAEGGIVRMAEGGQASKEDEAVPFANNIDQMRYELTRKNSAPVWDETGKQIDPNTNKPIQAPFQFDMANRSTILPIKHRADADWQKSVMAKPEEKGWDWALPGMLASPINALSRGLRDPNVVDANEVAMAMMGGSLGLSSARPAPAGSIGMATKTKTSYLPEYYHGSDVKGLTVLDPAASVGRRSEGSSIWVTPDETFAAGYPKKQTGSIYTAPLDISGFAKIDANFTSNKAISPNAMIYHSNGKVTPVSSLGQKITTDQLAAYARSKGDPGLRIMNVGDMGSGQFAGIGPNPSMYGESIAVFNPLKVSGERNVSDVAKQYATIENTKPLTEKQFYSRYSQHVDIRNRENQQGAETLKSIQESGWKPGFSVNTLPPYRGGMPTNVVDKKLAPRTGDYVYLVPNTFTTKTGNGLKINEGWTPKAHEAFQVTEDYPNMYKEYLKAFNAKAEGGAVRMADGGAVTDTLDKMVKSPQASNLLNLDLPNLIAAKQQVRPMKRGGQVNFSNNIDDMRYALTRHQG